MEKKIIFLDQQAVRFRQSIESALSDLLGNRSSAGIFSLSIAEYRNDAIQMQIGLLHKKSSMKIKNFQLSENLRIKFNKNESERFFTLLKNKQECKTFKELSEKLDIPYGRLKLYLENSRTIPLSNFRRWADIYKINHGDFDFRVIDLDKVLKEARTKGFLACKTKYGQEWGKILGEKRQKIFRIKTKGR